ncbi:hypothetical protein BHM03_00015739 [Ensete ventricosum]|uniref:Uncharacterized protein n=1 Tax=Ensete ventricosum TaxID=4639 RepID=A0A445MEJ8_ENSVE|nr:hypothetical protein BHM03_00015739 [Ensete ventricosum]
MDYCSGLKTLMALDHDIVRATLYHIVSSRTSCSVFSGEEIFFGIDDDSFVHRDPSAGDMWPAQFFTERGAKSVMISCPTFWAGEMPTSVGLVINPLWFSRGRLLPSLRLCLGISDESSPVLPWSPPTFYTALSIVIPSSSGGVALDDSRAVEALEMMQSCFNVDSTMTAHRRVDVREHYYSVDRCPRSGTEVLTAPCDRGVADITFSDSTQLMALSGGIPVGMLWVEHNGDPEPACGMFSLKLGTCRVLLDRP